MPCDNVGHTEAQRCGPSLAGETSKPLRGSTAHQQTCGRSATPPCNSLVPSKANAFNTSKPERSSHVNEKAKSSGVTHTQPQRASCRPVLPAQGVCRSLSPPKDAGRLSPKARQSPVPPPPRPPSAPPPVTVPPITKLRSSSNQIRPKAGTTGSAMAQRMNQTVSACQRRSIVEAQPVSARRVKSASQASPTESPRFPLPPLQPQSGRTGSSSSRSECTLPETTHFSSDEGSSTSSPMGELKESVICTTQGNVMLQAAPTHNADALLPATQTCGEAEQCGTNVHNYVNALTNELFQLLQSKQAAELALEELKADLHATKAAMEDAATQTDDAKCVHCESEHAQSLKAQQDCLDSLYETQKLQHTVVEGQRQLADCETRCCEWQLQAEAEGEARRKAEKERESIKAAALQLSTKWEEAKEHIKRDAQHIAELRNHVAILQAQHAQMDNDLQIARAHLRQMQVAMEVRDERDAGQVSPSSSGWVAEMRAHLQAEEILYRTYIEAEQAGTWQLMLAEALPSLSHLSDRVSELPIEQRKFRNSFTEISKIRSSYLHLHSHQLD